MRYATGVGLSTAQNMSFTVSRIQPKVGDLVLLKPSFTGAVNTPKEYSHGIVVSSESFYEARVEVLVGDQLWFLTSEEFELCYT